MLTQAEKDFVQSNLHGDVSALALKLGRFTDLNARLVLQQIAGYQAIEQKIPSWYRYPDLLFPQSISLEQCSSEATADYKRQLVSKLRDVRSMADLTGGFGVDCSFLARGMERVLYVERQAELCDLARNNFQVLALPQIEVRQGDGVEAVKTCPVFTKDNQSCKPFDLIFLDPARRDSKGGKVVALSDCEPDLTLIKPILLKQATYVLVKLSPMLDIALALKHLPETMEVHVVSVEGECKELLFLLKACPATDAAAEPVIHCVNLRTSSPSQIFTFKRSEEQNLPCLFAQKPDRYLYEPNASLLKAGAFSILAQVFDLHKLHPNSHLYTSCQYTPYFPGRVFYVESYFPFHSKDLKIHLDGMTKANITVRNFPNTVAEIRKKTKLREGGDAYLFATTLMGERKILICCSKP
ncbi:MAG: class I SAM-dependent methyltransferase [Bacteroidales bacterium]|nr:class I SAM-dependent methyltransferase [Bacteroidales bacterium]